MSNFVTDFRDGVIAIVSGLVNEDDTLVVRSVDAGGDEQQSMLSKRRPVIERMPCAVIDPVVFETEEQIGKDQISLSVSVVLWATSWSLAVGDFFLAEATPAIVSLLRRTYHFSNVKVKGTSPTRQYLLAEGENNGPPVTRTELTVSATVCRLFKG